MSYILTNDKTKNCKRNTTQNYCNTFQFSLKYSSIKTNINLSTYLIKPLSLARVAIILSLFDC